MRTIVLSEVFYTVGRTAAYLGLGALIIAGLLASGEIAVFLQCNLN